MQATSLNPNLEKKTKEFVETLKGGLSVENGPYPGAQSALMDMQEAQTFPKEVVREDYEVPLSDGGVMKVRLVRRADAEGDLPAVFFIHGGGWVAGDDVTHDQDMCLLAHGSHTAVLFPVYPLAPAVQFPVQLNQLWDVLVHITENRSEFRLTDDPIALIGESAGGNMAAVLARWARDRGHPKIALQILWYPVTNANLNSESYRAFADGPFLTKAAMEWYWKAYLPAGTDINQPDVSPLLLPDEEMKGLPPALIITAQNDPLQDDGETYARKLSDAGVEAVAVQMNGTIHDFMTLLPLANSVPTRAAYQLVNAALRKLFFGAGDKVQKENP